MENKVDPVGQISLAQLFDATPYQGERVRFSADVQTAINNGYASLYMSTGDEFDYAIWVDAPDWKQLEIVLDVPEKAHAIEVELIFAGDGQVLFDNLEFTIVDDSMPLTNR